MHITYTPEDGDRQEWDFDPGRVRSSQAEMIERRFGGNWDAWAAGVQGGNMRARRVLLWYLICLQHPGLRFEDTPDFFADELLVEYSVKEITELRERILKANLDEERREMTLTALDIEMTKAMERESGKASSATSVTTGGLPSPLS